MHKVIGNIPFHLEWIIEDFKRQLERQNFHVPFYTLGVSVCLLLNCIKALCSGKAIVHTLNGYSHFFAPVLVAQHFAPGARRMS